MSASFSLMVFPVILFIISLAVTLYYVTSDAEFNLNGHFLLLYRPFFREHAKHDLTYLRQWQESSYHIRGQQIKNLTLVFDKHRLRLSNRDHNERYENLISYLKKEFILQESFSMTLMQEIKFNAVHNFLTSDFYSPETKYHEANASKSKRFSIEVFKMKLEGASRDQVAEVLLKIKTRGLGENETIPRCLQIADRLLAM